MSDTMHPITFICNGRRLPMEIGFYHYVLSCIEWVLFQSGASRDPVADRTKYGLFHDGARIDTEGCNLEQCVVQPGWEVEVRLL